MMRRLAVFLAVSFLVTWTSWGILAPLARARTIVYGDQAFMLLYMLGGLGPTIAAYVAVLATTVESPRSQNEAAIARGSRLSANVRRSIRMHPTVAVR